MKLNMICKKFDQIKKKTFNNYIWKF